MDALRESIRGACGESVGNFTKEVRVCGPVLHHFRCATVVHKDDTAGMLRANAGKEGVGEGADIIHHGGTSLEAGFRNFGGAGIYRERSFLVVEQGNGRKELLQLLLRGNRFCAGPCALCAKIQPRGLVLFMFRYPLEEAVRRKMTGSGVGERSSITERIWREVQNGHEGRWMLWKRFPTL